MLKKSEILSSLGLVTLIAGLLALSGVPQVQSSNLTRTAPISLHQVPLASSGPPNRNYDHATVAMNSDRDIVVAFHSTLSPTLKQVEIAAYQHQPGDTWTYMGTEIVGGVDPDPLFLLLPGEKVKCERPDVVAVGERFFVVWTRRYQGLASYPNEPAVLECAWVDLSSGSINVLQNANPSGQGFILDKDNPQSSNDHFWVKECAGVPDAVPLHDPHNPYKVAVVYPSQTQFSTSQSQDRTFELRVVTCLLDPVSDVVSLGTVQPLKTLVPQVQFNGPTSPNLNSTSAGLILPEVAPSLEDDAFWVAAERQVEIGGAPEGKIYLGYWKWVAGMWTEQASRTYQTGSSGTTFFRRRPMISSYPETGRSPVVGLAFNKIDVSGQPPNLDVIYTQVAYDPSGGLITPPFLPQWPNDPAIDDQKPAAVMGRAAANISVAYAGRSPGLTASSDLINIQGTIIDSSPHETDARPALSYQYDPTSSDPDYVAVSWEKTLSQGGQVQVWVGVE